MAHSKYEYVKKFEMDDRILPNVWLVVRIDGRGFTKFSEEHGFVKPNDERGLGLMNECALYVFQETQDCVLAFGESDEYSFLLKKSTTLFERRASKIATTIASMFAAAYVYNWSRYFGDRPLKRPPCFDARVVAYPSEQNVRDYFSWRQVDTHVNNQYNTCFWALVHSGCSTEEAQQTLKGTLADFKNELLFSRFGINYAKLPAMFRKGSIIVKQDVEEEVERDGVMVKRTRRRPVVLHEDLIQDAFWLSHPWVLAAD